jgi:Protein of unknown function (DUF669)
MDFTQLPKQFDRTPEERSYEPLPKGWYVARLVEVEDKPTKSGGLMDSHTWEIIAGDDGDPKYQGRSVFNHLNIICPSSDIAEDIARREIKAIAFAVRAPIDWTKSDQFLGIPVRIKLGIEAATDQFEAKNTLKGYARYESGQPQSAPAVPSPASAPGAFPFGASAPAAAVHGIPLAPLLVASPLPFANNQPAAPAPAPVHVAPAETGTRPKPAWRR